jgi:TRAP-type C4-dicarboxylate transport system permease small subunit
VSVDMTEAARPPITAARGPRLHAVARGFGYLAAIVFGYGLLVLSAVVVVEAVGRKLLGFSLQGADELGGYIFAVGSALCFASALVERGHIRIDLFHAMFPAPVRAALDWLSIALMAVFAVMITWLAWLQLADSAEYHSTAPTPWATALVWPQALWFGALGLFALLALVFAVDATRLLLGGRLRDLARHYGPKETIEEVREELEDMERR